MFDALPERNHGRYDHLLFALWKVSLGCRLRLTGANHSRSDSLGRSCDDCEAIACVAWGPPALATSQRVLA